MLPVEALCACMGGGFRPNPRNRNPRHHQVERDATVASQPLQVESVFCPAFRTHRRQGITLLELVTVVLIVGIASAVAVPRFSRTLGAIRGKTAVARFAADLNYLRQQAITGSKSVAVVFTASPRGYESSDVEMPGQPGTTFRVDLDEQLSGARIIVDPALRSGVTYNHWGIPSASGTILIEVGQREWQVTISPTTGIAEVSEQ